MSSFSKYINPYLGELLELICMDKEFLRGDGCLLYDREGNEYLDFVAAYGALPFGFNHKDIWETMDKVRHDGEPSFVQPSDLVAGSKLAEKLVEITPEGIEYVTFTNSGAEAVEAAIKMCRSKTGRMGVLSTYNSFHGKTFGALSATGKKQYQDVFGAPAPGFEFIEYGDIEALHKSLRENPEKFGAFIVEPIQGEGGIIIPPEGYLKKAEELCKEYDVCFVIDEIQTGMGRTGSLFACEYEGIKPDIITIAKALGGGLVPIGACMSRPSVYSEDYGNKHSSTFAGNTLACRVGLKVCQLLERNNNEILSQVTENGNYLKAELKKIKDKHPNIIKDVRGKGLMIGIDFSITRNSFRSTNLISLMAEQDMLTPLISSYLLNIEKLRVAPTLNGASVIRIEPPLIVSREQCKKAVEAINKVVQVLAECNTAKFVGHLIGNPGVSCPRVVAGKPGKPRESKKDDDEGRFAFLVHPLDLENYTDFDKSLEGFSRDELCQLVSKWNQLVEPFVVGNTRIISQTGDNAYGEFVVVPRTAAELVSMSRHEGLQLVKTAADLATERGAKLIGLGAYTSIVARGGRAFLGEPYAVTTGNSYTVVSAVEAIVEALNRFNISLGDARAAVVGATGAIGRCVSILLSEDVQSLVLIGNPKHPDASRRRLLKIAAEIYRHLSSLLCNNKQFAEGTLPARIARIREGAGLPHYKKPVEEFIKFAGEKDGHGGYIDITTEIEEVLPESDVVVSATSSVNELITPDMLKVGSIVCDMSRPLNVSKQVKDVRKDVLVIDGGVIEVPGRPDFGWDFGFEAGLSYACMAETFMLALEKKYEDTSVGDLDLETINLTRTLAEKHGFKLAGLRSFDRPLSNSEWNAVCKARQRELSKSVI